MHDTDGERLEHALGLAYRFLAMRDRTVTEVYARLIRANVGEPTVEAAVATLLDQGYLDDARYALRFAEDRRRLDGWGSERIERRLRSLGLTSELIATALAEQEGGEALAAAVAVLRTRVRVLPSDPAARQRALAMLVRRGYELELAHDALRAFTGREHDELGPDASEEW